MTSEALALAPAGHNNPPEPTPFELSKREIEDLAEEARNWLDGTAIASQEIADQIGKLKGLMSEAIKTADARRKVEVKPLDEAKAEIQARYNPLIADTKGVTGIAVRTIAECEKALTPWLLKLERERQAAAEAARKEAEEKAAAAQAAVRAALDLDFAAKEEAEALLVEAKKTEKAAVKLESTKAHVAGAGRAIGLRSVEVIEVQDAVAAVRDIGLTDGMRAAIITAAREYRAEWGKWPAGVSAITERRL